MDQFKDNIMGLLVSEKKIKLFENIDTAVKAHFTKTFNNMNTSSIKLKKTKGSSSGPAPPGSGFGSKFDPDI